MAKEALAAGPLLPEAELARLARILARHLAGRQPSASGTQTVKRVSGQGLDFLDFRDYQPGDDTRTIDWRASAHSRHVQIRRYCGEVASDWYLCVDSSASMSIDDGANRALAKQLSAALCYVLLHLGHRVGLILFSGEIEAVCALGRGHSQYANILRTLYSHSYRSHGGSSDIGVCAALVGTHHPLMVVSDFLAQDAMVAPLAKLLARQRELHLFQLHAASLWALPEGEPLLLEDVESGGVVPSGDPTIAREFARQRASQLQQDLSQWARRFHVPHTLCNADDNWRDLLLRHFIAG